MGRRIKVGNGSTNTSTNEQEQQTGTGGTETVERGATKNGSTSGGENGNGNGGNGSGGNENGNGVTERERTSNIPKEVVLNQGKPKKVPVSVDGETVEPSKKKRTRKTKSKEADPTEIIKFLSAVNAIIPQNTTLSVLKLSEKEIENIAQPLANILEKNGIGEKIAEKSDTLALASAITIAYAPRAYFVINTIKQQKENEKEIKNYERISDNANKTTEIPTSSNENDGGNGNAVYDRTNGNSFSELLPPTVG